MFALGAADRERGIHPTAGLPHASTAHIASTSIDPSKGRPSHVKEEVPSSKATLNQKESPVPVNITAAHGIQSP